MNNNYLIPANSKKSMLIFGLFNKFDLILFASGILATMLMVMILPIDNLVVAILALLPAAVTGFLVFPVPNYHNTLTVIMAAWMFFTTRQKFIWKGWCVMNGEEGKK